MGYRVGVHCWVDQSDAFTAYLTRQPMGAGGGTGQLLWWFDRITGVWHLLVYNNSGGLIIDKAVNVPAFASCGDAAYAADRAVVFWGVALAVAVAVAALAVRRVFRGPGT